MITPEEIKEIRQARGWTQVRLARELELDYGKIVSYWETGEHKPQPRNEKALRKLEKHTTKHGG